MARVQTPYSSRQRTLKGINRKNIPTDTSLLNQEVTLLLNIENVLTAPFLERIISTSFRRDLCSAVGQKVVFFLCIIK